MFPSGMTSIDMENVKSIEQFADSAVLSEPQALLSALFNASSLGLAVLDDQLRFRAVNRALASMNGVAPNAHLGKTIRAVLGKGAIGLEDPFKHVFSTGREVSNLEVSAKLSKRTDVGYWVENYVPIRDATGTVKQVCAIVVEITEQKKLQQLLRDVTERLIRNPLFTTPDSEALLRHTMEGSLTQTPESRSYRNRSVVMDLSNNEPSFSRKAMALTPREREVVKLLADGHGNKGTAAILGISVKTVETHRQRIMLKLGVHTATDLLHYAISNKILDPEHMGHVRARVSLT